MTTIRATVLCGALTALAVGAAGCRQGTGSQSATPAAPGPTTQEATMAQCGDPNEMTDEQWRQRLTEEQYRVMRQQGTERAFTGRYWKTKTPGQYLCAACGQVLFESKTKFESGTGWPSFYAPANQASVTTQRDDTLGMERTEVRCSRCGAHLGHVFDDGPDPTGMRFCINSVALDLKEDKQK